MVSSLSGSVLVALAFAGPPSVGSDDEAIGVVWKHEATGPSTFRQRVLDALAQAGQADAEPRTVIDRADQRARVSVAQQLPRERADTIVRLSQELTGATARFREGDLSGAEADVAVVLGALQAEPVLPGVAALTYSALVLRAQVAWTAGDAELARASMALAVALDPDLELSTRRVPPAIASLHAEVRAAITGARDAWLPITVVADPTSGPVMVEIDGRPGRRRVPVGRHFVVVRRPGRAPLAFVAEAGATIEVPDQPEFIAAGLPADAATAEAICDHADADRLVLAEVRDDRLALEGYRCGDGFGGVWFSEPYPLGQPPGPPDAALSTGAATSTRDVRRSRDRSRLAAATPWPEPKPPPAPPDDVGPTDGPVDPVPPKPWYKRAWIWSVIGGVVVAGVTTGAVLGTREQPPEVRIDAPSFLDP